MFRTFRDSFGFSGLAECKLMALGVTVKLGVAKGVPKIPG